MSSLPAYIQQKGLMTVERSDHVVAVLSFLMVACSGSGAAEESGGRSTAPEVTQPAPSSGASSSPQVPAASTPVTATSSTSDGVTDGTDAAGPSATPQAAADDSPPDPSSSDTMTATGMDVDESPEDSETPANESAADNMQSPGADEVMAGADAIGDPTPMASEESEDPLSDEVTPDEEFTGTCTESQVTRNASGTGSHDVIIETNSDPGIEEGTIFRPADMGGDEKYPILVWGQGGCSQNGLSNETAMAEIASHGYFVVADGTPNGSGNRMMDRSDMEAMGAPLVAYIDWAVAENDKPCSAYYQSLDTAMISSNGFSCGGLMAQGTVTDPRIVTWGVTSSGMAGATQAFYDAIDTPVLFVEGGPAEVAYDGGLEGYEAISALGVPVLWFSKDIGHGGDLFQPDGGDFTRINLAWLNWWLKGDESATGKGMLVGADCVYCSDPAWEVMSANLP